MASRHDRADRPVEILFEGDADAGAPGQEDALDGGPSAGTGHVVGTDRLAALVGAVSETVEELREQRRTEAMANVSGGALATVLPERVAQVIQATRTPLESVLALLVDGLGADGPVRLEPTAPTVADGVATFRGALALRRPRGRRLVNLRVYPTASANLTVLELVPRRRWMPQTERYLRAGVPAMTELTDRIEAATAANQPEDQP